MFDNKVLFFLADSCSPGLKELVESMGGVILEEPDPKRTNFTLVGNSFALDPYKIFDTSAVLLESWVYMSKAKGFPVAMNPFFPIRNSCALVAPPLRLRDECHDCIARGGEKDDLSSDEEEEEEEPPMKRKKFTKETEDLIRFVDRNKDLGEELWAKAEVTFPGRTKRGLQGEFNQAFLSFIRSKS